MKKRFHRSIAIVTALFLVIGVVGMSFTTVDSYATNIKGKSQGDDEDDKSLLEKGKDAAEKGKDAAKDAAKKGKDAAKDAAEKGKKAANDAKGAALNGKDAALRGGKTVTDKALGLYNRIDKEEFKKGWDHAVDVATSEAAAQMGSKYVNQVSNAIEYLRVDINSSMGSKLGVAQEAGFVAEKWAVDTFNIDAARKGSSSRASRPDSNKWASADIETNYGEQASLKYYKEASASANEQAKTVIEKYGDYKQKSKKDISFEEYVKERGFDPKTDEELLKDGYRNVYENQTKIIPKDQLDEAKAYIEGRIDKLSNTPGGVSAERAKAYQETLDSLRDRLEDPKGVESKPLSYDELQTLTELAEEGKFDPMDPKYKFALPYIITPKYIVKQAINTGGKTAAMNVAITLGPELYVIIAKGIKTGEIDKKDFEKMGADALTSGTEGFLEGSVSSAILVACKAGKFGPQMTNVSPDMVGALTVIAIDSIRYGYALSKGEITPLQYGDLMAEEVITSAGAMAAGAGLALLLGNSLIITMAGCMAGGMLASIGYNMGKQAALEVRDAGGFAAVIPTGTIEGMLIEKKVLAGMKLNRAPTLLKGMFVSTKSDGGIIVAAPVSDRPGNKAKLN